MTKEQFTKHMQQSEHMLNKKVQAHRWNLGFGVD
jgi:hypothetical protein